MDLQMPRGAIPSPRSELAASEPYQPDGSARVFVPRGDFPTSNSELAAAQPYKASGVAPESFLALPEDGGFWGNGEGSHPLWVEEAFAKACVEPKVVVPADVVLLAAKECGSSNFAQFMQTHGFVIHGTAYRDGAFHSVHWTNPADLKSAIATVGPVKVGVPAASLASCPHGEVTPGMSGWAIYGVPPAQPGDHCASLCGYGSLAALTALFKQHGIEIKAPSGMPSGLCFAMFTAGSAGIVDEQSLLNVIGEAWVRSPTTVVKELRG